MLLPLLLLVDLQNAISTTTVLQHSIAADQGTLFTAKEALQWVHAHGINLLTMFPTTLKQLVWQTNGVAFWRPKVLARWQYLAGMEQDSLEDCICAESVFNIEYCFFCSHNSQVQKSQGRNESGIPIITPSDPRAKVLYPVPMTVLLGLSSEGRNPSTQRHPSDSTELQGCHWPLWATHASESPAKRELLAGVADPDYWVEFGLLFHEEEYVWNTGDFCKILLKL